MARNKFSVKFDGLDVYRKKLDQLGGGQAVKRAFDEALKDTQNLIADKVGAAMARHDDTGKVKRTIIKNQPAEWSGDVAAVSVGFNIRNPSNGELDGLPSIFLMYGTQLYGQPHITPDRNLYNAVYGAAVKRQIKEIQKNAFIRVIDGVMNT